MRRLGMAVCGLGLLAYGCNPVLGIDAPTLEPQAETAAPIMLEHCLLNSDCTRESEVCIFEVCSPPCERDRDCAEPRECLHTEQATACVDPQQSTCERDQDCPDGTGCAGSSCRTRCDDDEGCLAGQTCKDAACQPQSTGPQGSARTTAAACEAGQKRCQANRLQSCGSDGEWDDGALCAYICHEDACAGQCVPGAHQCAGSSLQTCTEFGVWQDEMTCPQQCTPAGCVERCEAGEKQCDGLTLRVCTTEGAQATERTCEYACAQGACAGECIPSTTRCSGTSLQLCSAAGEWTASAECEFSCTVDHCGGECMPGDRDCVGALEIRECDQQGSWRAAEACDHQACVDDACVGECAPGERRCADDTHAEICGNDGQWGSSSACPFMCEMATGQCGGDCANGTLICVNGAPSTSESHRCVSGSFMLADTCNYPSQLCDDGQCAANGRYDIGFTAALPNNSSVMGNLLIGIPIAVDRRVRVVRLGLVGRATPGVRVKMALYRSNGGSGNSNAPRDLLTVTDQALVSEGDIRFEPQIAVTLNPGWYWLMAVYDGGANTYQANPGSGRAVYISQDYAMPYPQSFPNSGVLLPGLDLNHFMEVQNSL